MARTPLFLYVSCDSRDEDRGSCILVDVHACLSLQRSRQYVFLAREHLEILSLSVCIRAGSWSVVEGVQTLPGHDGINLSVLKMGHLFW